MLALAGFLTLVALALLDARKSVSAIADALEAVAVTPHPRAEARHHQRRVERAAGGLDAADQHLGRAARAFRL